MTSRPKIPVLAVLLLATAAISGGTAQCVEVRPEPAPLVKPPVAKKDGGEDFAKALAAAAEGKRALGDITIAGSTFALYGSGIGFAGDVQVTLPAGKLAELVKAIHDAGFADWAPTYGGLRRPPGGPALGAPERLVRSLSVRLGSAQKTVTQLGGEVFQPLADLCAKIEGTLLPLAEKGLKLGGLSLNEAFAALAEGKLAPEALSLALTDSPRRGGAAKSPVQKFVHGNLEWLESGLQRKSLPRAQQEAAAKRLGALLKETQAGDFPVQLYHPASLIGLHVDIRGLNKNISMTADTGPHNLEQKKKHPEAQANFEKLLAGLQAFFRETCAKP